MRFKLDENFGARTQQLFQDAGHEVHTVLDESLQGVSDERLFEVCCAEQRCLVTLDLDSADVTRFPPERTGGVAIIRVSRNPSLSLLESLINQFLKLIAQMSIEGKLWIVEIGRIRIHQSSEES
ncbi:MAG: DUF5615 family PIN-like protein [Chloroflexota bacterium]